MSPAFALSSVTVVVSLCLAALGLRRGRTALHWAFVAASLSIAVWSGSLAGRDLLPGAEWVEAWSRLQFVGLMSYPSLWLALVLMLSPQGRGARRPVPIGWLMLPGAVGYLAMLSNGAHHGVLRESAEIVQGTIGWAGPLFLLYSAWAVCAHGAAALGLARSARHLWGEGDRTQACEMVAAGALPLAAAAATILGLLPAGYTLMPASCAASLAVLAVSALRYELVAQVPLAHRDVIDSLRAGVLVADGDGELLEMNPAAARLLEVARVAPGMVVAETVAAIAPPDSRDGVKRELLRLDRRTRPLRLHLYGERGRRIDVWGVSLHNGTGKSAGQVVVLRDRTEEIRYAEIIQRTEKLETVGTLAAGVAHEINNPLAFVRANLSELARMGEVVQGREPDSKLTCDLADLRDIALETLEGVDRIERVVADMRRLSAAPGDGFTPLFLDDVARDAARLARLRLGPGAPIELEFGEVARVEGSAPLLVQAVLNLLVNALQAVEHTLEPRIRVTTSREGDVCLLRVMDNGPGIPDGFAVQVFEPFFSTRSDGTGLGLAVSRDVARDHGGELVYEPSVSLGQSGEGACFSIRLPALYEEGDA
jgi:signal transduction histidine kinase